MRLKGTWYTWYVKFSDLLFALQHPNPLLKSGPVIFLTLKVDYFSEGRQNNFHSVVASESVSNPLKAIIAISAEKL